MILAYCMLLRSYVIVNSVSQLVSKYRLFPHSDIVTASLLRFHFYNNSTVLKSSGVDFMPVKYELFSLQILHIRKDPGIHVI